MDDPSYDDLAHAFRRGYEEAQGMRGVPAEEATEVEQAARDLGRREGHAKMTSRPSGNSPTS